MTMQANRISGAEIDGILQEAGIAPKTILNYRCRINGFLDMVCNSEHAALDEQAIDTYFQRLETGGASEAVRSQARFALQAWFRCNEEPQLADYLGNRFRQEDPLASHHQQIKKVLEVYGEQRKFSGYRKDFCLISEALVGSPSEWTEENLHAFLIRSGEEEPALKKSYWYFLLAADRADLAQNCRFKFTPTLPVAQAGWKEILADVSTSAVIRRIYNRAAGMAHAWMKINGVDHPRTGQISDLRKFVLDHTGETGHSLVDKSLKLYLRKFYAQEEAR